MWVMSFIFILNLALSWPGVKERICFFRQSWKAALSRAADSEGLNSVIGWMDIVESSIWLHRHTSRHRRGETLISRRNSFLFPSEEHKPFTSYFHLFTALLSTGESRIKPKPRFSWEFLAWAERLAVGASPRINGWRGPTDDRGVKLRMSQFAEPWMKTETAVFWNECPCLGPTGGAAAASGGFCFWFVPPGRRETGKQPHLPAHVVTLRTHNDVKDAKHWQLARFTWLYLLIIKPSQCRVKMLTVRALNVKSEFIY